MFQIKNGKLFADINNEIVEVDVEETVRLLGRGLQNIAVKDRDYPKIEDYSDFKELEEILKKDFS